MTRHSRNGHAKPSRISSALDALLLNEAMGGLVGNLATDRSRFLASLLDPRRDLDHECGFPKDPIRLEIFQELFDRHPIANRYISIMDDECWQETPLIYEDENPDTTTGFEIGFQHLGDNLDSEEDSYYEDQEGLGNPIYPYIKQWGIEAGVGEYGIMLLGFDDKKASLRDPLKRGSAKKLLFIRVFSQSDATIATWDEDPNSPRYGRPNTYNLDTLNTEKVQTVTGGGIWSKGALNGVHWTRVLHLSKDPGANRYLSRPLLRPVLNDILSLSKPLYGSGEGYWRAGLPTFLAKTDPKLGGSVRINRQKIRDQMEQWLNSAQKVLIANGWSMESVSGSVSDPKAFIDCHLDAICVKGAYPKRVFLGSERGELASSDDAKKWEARKRQYTKTSITPKQLVPFVNRNIYAGTLPAPKKSYFCDWSTDEHLTDSEKADIFVKKMQGLAAAVSGGVTTFIGEMGVLQAAGYSDEEAQQLLDAAALAHEKEMEKQAELQAQLPPDPNAPPNGQFPPEPGQPKPGGPIPPSRQLPPPQPKPVKNKRRKKEPASRKKPKGGLDEVDSLLSNAFCATGAGGGIDPTFSPGDTGQGQGALRAANANEAFTKLPQQVQDTLKNVGWRLEMLPASADYHGEANPSTKVIKLKEKVEPGDLNKAWHPGVTAEQMTAYGVAHEAGHALDFHLGTPSQKDAFKAAYKQDLKGIPMEVRSQKDNGYFLSGREGGRQEAFAHLAAHAMGSDYNHGLTAMLPKTAKLVKDLLESRIGLKQTTANAFCPTGQGGGVDPSCSSGGSSGVGQVATHFGGHADALGKLGSTMSALNSGIAALKALGVNVGHAEHIAKEFVSDKIGKAVGKLPGPVQTAVRGAWAGVRVGMGAAFATYTASQAFAEKVSKERGHSPEEARRLRGILSTIDVAAAKPIALTLGATASFAPVASLSYLAYSTSRNPMATLRAARKSLTDWIPEQKLRTTLGNNMVQNEGDTDALVKAVEDHGFDDFYIALLSLALDATQDIAQAVDAANKAYEASKK